MRYIDKTYRCKDFDDFVTTYKNRLRSDWEKFKKIKGGSAIRLILHQHTWRVQKGLCAYCEQEIPEKTKPEEELKSHLEHVRAKTAFPHLTYIFENIIVSCEGFDLKIIAENKREFCGHVKDDKRRGNTYEEAFFLNPTEITDIESYFYYDNKGNIEPHPSKTVVEQEQAAYMIRVLGLDHPTLIEMRRNEYNIWLEKQIDWSEERLIEELSELKPLLPSFFSMLKQKIL
jgi:uncharacterized protein (TIGR02646 family)